MRPVVGVLRGGPSSEYEVSLQSGANVLQNLDQEKYEPRDIFIDRNGEWHVHGRAMAPERALEGVNVALNILHGEYGEGGEVQNILEESRVPYSGSDAFASKIAFDKHRTKEIVSNVGVKVARGVLIEPGNDLEDVALDIFRSFPHPAIVKPAIGGSSVGVSLADSYQALEDGIRNALRVSPKVLVEEYIKGKEATVGVVDGFRGEKQYALLPVEIIPAQGHSIFSYDAKYGGQSTERCPGNFTKKETQLLTEAAKRIHEVLGASHYSRSDFIVSKRGIYFLELNSAAAVGMTKESLFPKALEASSAKLADFFDHIIQLALNR
jgi:D-alanine-D-alanine ligase